MRCRHALLVLGLSLALVSPSLSRAQPHPQSAVQVPMPSSPGPARAWTSRRWSACAHGDGAACSEAAFSYRLGRDGAVRDPLTALHLYARAWALDANGGAALAQYEIVRSERPPLPPGLRTDLERVCEAGCAYTCGALGLAGLDQASARSEMRRALDRLSAACHAGAGQVCYDLGPETGFLRSRFPWYFASDG